jgi:hypothetical protein
MTLRKRGKYWYGDSQADIRDELTRIGKLNEYVPTHFVDARCRCGGVTFQLRMDEDEGAAVRICTAGAAVGVPVCRAAAPAPGKPS